MERRKEYVYVLTHLPTNKKYVGRTVNPQRRYMEHMNALIHGKHYNKHMQADYNKYGGGYQFDVVCVETKADTEGFLQDEKTLMRKLKTYDERFGYNDKDPAMAFVRCIYDLPSHKRARGVQHGNQRAWRGESAEPFASTVRDFIRQA